MLRSRVIPFLLLDGNGFYKTEEFSNPKYIGDPINTVKIFNEKNVDELSIFDISASSKNKINFDLLERIAKEARMPLTYGGGVQTAEHARILVGLGFEKISINTSFFYNKSIFEEISNAIGSQSIVFCLDVKKTLFGGYDIYLNRGKEKIGVSIRDVLKSINYDLLGEVIINNISHDGKQNCIDLNLFKLVRPLVKCHLTMVGGLSGVDEINKLINDFYPIGLGGGACFVFKGKFKAVLISYCSGLRN
jgi:cyclase